MESFEPFHETRAVFPLFTTKTNNLQKWQPSDEQRTESGNNKREKREYLNMGNGHEM